MVEGESGGEDEGKNEDADESEDVDDAEKEGLNYRGSSVGSSTVGSRNFSCRRRIKQHTINYSIRIFITKLCMYRKLIQFPNSGIDGIDG